MTQPDGTRTPQYVSLSGPAQVQDLSIEDLRQIEGLNISGLKKSVYINGQWSGVVRADQQGGDIFGFDGAQWLAVSVLEGWTRAGWSKVLVVMQSPRPQQSIGDPYVIGFSAIGMGSIGSP